MRLFYFDAVLEDLRNPKRMQVYELYRKGIKIWDNVTVKILHNSSVIEMVRENNRQGRGTRRIHDSDAWRSHGPRQVRALFARFFAAR